VKNTSEKSGTPARRVEHQREEWNAKSVSDYMLHGNVWYKFARGFDVKEGFI
jgi:hypothetical protein